MKLGTMLYRATQDRQVMVESSVQTWSTGEGNGKSLQYACLRTPWTIWKDKKIGYWKMNSPGWQVPNMLLEISGEITLEIMKRQSQSINKAQWWMRLVMEAGSDYCSKEQYCIETWNVKSMNQGKLEVAKQEMARVSINILGISELKRTRMGEFSSDDHYIYDCGQESLRRNGVALIIKKRVWNIVLGWDLKNDRWSLFVSKANHSISW